MNNMTMNTRNFLVAATIVLGLGTATGANSQDTSDRPIMNEPPRSDDNKSAPQTGSKDGKITIPMPILMMVPVEVSTDAEKKGCWVKLYDKKNYEGDSLMLMGPISLGRMVGPFGFDWENKVRSLQTGPKTDLTIFDNRNFRDHNKFITGGKSVPDMSEKMGFMDDFRSMIVSCTGTSTGS
ncbi:beta/gamma crystallin domain-containing protein [Nitrosomonas sp. Nm166]|uniref:beta/gamma crystallin domain-containing protein n=1 Tax=Nitrosomonas sp. Nm166 TaxID=1881054 RepID=UPI0008EA0ABA|nr:beta/gamma crystallin domain-containing protein [Nitrosomonas sp. Nm166]SFD86595.1 Beta/Gamma crystallin [Nitrosomonas sp. Nm166]